MAFKIYSLIKNICIKLFLFFLITNIILEENCKKKEVSKLENYYSKLICKLFYFTINYNCPAKIFSSISFYDEILEINKDINLLINVKKSKLLLLEIFPFLKNNSTLSYKINNKEINNFLKRTFNNKKIKYRIINFDFNDFNIFNGKINELLDNIRYLLIQFFYRKYRNL